MICSILIFTELNLVCGEKNNNNYKNLVIKSKNYLEVNNSHGLIVDDIDSDGIREIITMESFSTSEFAYSYSIAIFNSNSYQLEWKSEKFEDIASYKISCADINNDAIKDILFITNQYLYIFNGKTKNTEYKLDMKGGLSCLSTGDINHDNVRHSRL